jgi:uncharacterized membrane protein YidH (DUF202 family)
MVLKSKLDFSSNTKLSFWASVGDHYRNNRAWLLYGKGKLAMISVTSAYTNADETKKKSDEKRDRIMVILIILFLLLLFSPFYFCVLFNWPFCLCGCVCKRGWAASISTMWRGIIYDRLWRLSRHLSWRTRRAKKSLKEQQISWELHRCCILPPWVGQVCNDTINGFLSAGSLFLFNAGLWYGSFLLFTDNAALCLWQFYYWRYFWWPRHSIRVIYVTIMKPVITLTERNFMLWARTSMGTKPDGHGFWTGFDNLVPPLMTAFNCDISYTSTTYAYVIIV